MHDAAVGHQCPDCVRQGRTTRMSARTAFGGTLAGAHGHVTKALIGVNVAVFVLALILGGGAAASGSLTDLHLRGSLLPGLPGFDLGVVNGEYYRLITSMFLHSGLLHLALNMLALWVVGGVLEPLLGRARFLALYLVSGLGGSVAVYLTAGLGVYLFNQEQPLFGTLTTPTVGASGAVFGLFGAFYVVLRRLRRSTSAITLILAINIVLTFTIPGISVAGHLGGLATGAVVAAGLAYAPRQHRTAVQVATIGAVTLVLIVLTVVRTASLA